MDGKIVLVTGATNGIGKVTALELARMGAEVIVAGRNPAKGAEVVDEIKLETGSDKVVLMLADFVGSTRGIAGRVAESTAKEFIIGTEEGLVHHLKELRPDAEFYVIPPGLCPNMKRITLMDVARSLESMTTSIELDDELIRRARMPVDRMLKIKRAS